MAKSKRRISTAKTTRKSKAVQRQTKSAKASRAARKGWETRRERAAEQERARKRIKRLRAERAREKADKEAKRLRKWRKSYREYLKFKVAKVEREELAIPEKQELICRVLFDAEAEEYRQENIWTNIEYLSRASISQILAQIPGTSGVVRATFLLIEGEEYADMQRGAMEDMEEETWGRSIQLEWDLDVEPRVFWSEFYAHARTLLPARPEKGGQDYKASWLGVTHLEACYAPGETNEE